MRPALLALALILAGCATRAPPPPEPPRPPLVQSALAEWEAWGRVVVEGYPTFRPPDMAATPERFARLEAYWEAVPGGVPVARRHATMRGRLAATRDGEAAGWEDIGVYSRPAWSAAFISYVVRQSGIPSWDLPSSSRHASYIDAALARAGDPQAGFVPKAPEDYAPRPGDLICADRSPAPLRHWTERIASRGRPRPMHCDVVVATKPGMIEAVGGNVLDVVTLRRLPADEEGRVLPPPPGVPPFMLILAAQSNGG
jgi:hypothetical protein